MSVIDELIGFLSFFCAKNTWNEQYKSLWNNDINNIQGRGNEYKRKRLICLQGFPLS